MFTHISLLTVWPLNWCLFSHHYKASWATNTTGIFFLFLLCNAGYSSQLLITETGSWFSLIPAETCESQASLNTQWDTSAASDYEYIIHQKNLTLTDRETSSLYENWSNSPCTVTWTMLCWNVITKYYIYKHCGSHFSFDSTVKSQQLPPLL